MSCVKVDKNDNQINIVKPDEEANVKSFAYDAVYDTDSQQ
jgi:kinesin family member 17